MYAAKDIITAGRITRVEKVASLSGDYFPTDSFSMFLVPKGGSTEMGDVVIVEAILPHSDGAYVDVPVVAGDWSPVVFRALKSGSIDLSDVDLYVAPITKLTL